MTGLARPSSNPTSRTSGCAAATSTRWTGVRNVRSESRRRRRGERERLAVGGPCRIACVPIAARELAAVLRLHVEDVEMLAQRTEEAGAIRLVAEAIDDNGLGRPRGSRAVLLALVGRGGRSVAAANAICEPSGLHTGAPAPSRSVVSCSGSPPSAGRSHTCAGPSSARRNAIAEPSGDHAGEVSDRPRVSRRGPRSSPSETHQRERTDRSASASAVRSTYAQMRASGASAGCSGTASSSRSSIR